MKEIRQFLVKRRVPVDNCREKADLIDVLMQYSNNAQYRQEQLDNEARVQQLQARMYSKAVVKAVTYIYIISNFVFCVSIMPSRNDIDRRGLQEPNKKQQ